MSRLDSLSQEELNKLYVRSAYLYQPGILQLIGIIIGTVAVLIGMCFPYLQGNTPPVDWLVVSLVLLPLFLITFFLMFSSAYVFMYVRSKGAKIFFRIWSILGIIGSVLSVFSGGWPILGAIIGILICFQIGKSAKTDALFGPDQLTHAQIALARKKKRRNEPFTDEELPKSLPNPTFSKICVVCAYVFLVLLVLSPFINQAASEAQNSSRVPSSQEGVMSLVKDGEKLLKNKDYSGAYKAFSEAAKQGSPVGKLNLALCLVEGYGCDANPEKAFALFSEESVRAFPLAKFYVGVMRMNGIGCSQDYKKAYELLSQQDVQQTFPIARVSLGVLFAEGSGVKQDSSKAYALLNDEAVMKLSPVARFYVAAFLMEGEVCKKDEHRAFSLMNDVEVLKAQPSAKYMLGIWYYAGVGTKQDFAKAAQLLKAAADAGEPNAAQFLGYKNGKMPDYGMTLEELLKRHWNANK